MVAEVGQGRFSAHARRAILRSQMRERSGSHDRPQDQHYLAVAVYEGCGDHPAVADLTGARFDHPLTLADDIDSCVAMLWR